MKKARILIDLDKLKDATTGLGQVAYHFGNTLAQIEDDELHFTYLVPEKYKNFFGNKVDYEVISLKRRFFPSLCPKYDLWYTIHQDSNLFPDSKTPYLITINDLNFLGEKSASKARQRLANLQKKVNRAVGITCISKYTADVVKQNLNTGKLPVDVIYCGVEVEEFPDAHRPAYVPEGDILFSIGVIQPKKNTMVLLEFMKNIPDNYKLIVAGNKSGSYSVEIEKRIQELGLQERILLPGKISDADKYWLLNNCKAVLFPSKFEGMGFPPVEAMRFGKPVFASTLSSIPEVSGDKAYYWENFEPHYMATFFLDHIKQFYSDAARPAILKEHSMKYTWSEAAKAYIHLFKTILAQQQSR